MATFVKSLLVRVRNDLMIGLLIEGQAYVMIDEYVGIIQSVAREDGSGFGYIVELSDCNNRTTKLFCRFCVRDGCERLENVVRLNAEG